MLKSSAIAAVLVGVLGTGASASAATAGWMVNGTQLTSTAAVASTSSVDEVMKLSGGGIEVECTGKTVQMLNPTITAANRGNTSSLILGGCAAKTTNCDLSVTSIRTLPLTMEVTLEGALNTEGKITPTTGTELATFKFEGEKCAVAGTKPVTGSAVVSFPRGQVEFALHPGEVNITATELTLKLASSAAKISGAALVRLASSTPWSFL